MSLLNEVHSVTECNSNSSPLDFSGDEFNKIVLLKHFFTAFVCYNKSVGYFHGFNKIAALILVDKKEDVYVYYLFN
jgi:hypothetical protein